MSGGRRVLSDCIHCFFFNLPISFLFLTLIRNSPGAPDGQSRPEVPANKKSFITQMRSSKVLPQAHFVFAGGTQTFLFTNNNTSFKTVAFAETVFAAMYLNLSATDQVSVDIYALSMP